MTFLQRGKAVCHAKQIPEDVLYRLSAEVLGLERFDESVFKKRIKEIRISAFNHMVFVFFNGHEVERVWRDRSRRESWTDDMKQKAAAHAKRRKRL